MSELDHSIPDPDIRFRGSRQRRTSGLLGQAGKWSFPGMLIIRLCSVALYASRLIDRRTGKAFSADELATAADSPVKIAIESAIEGIEGGGGGDAGPGDIEQVTGSKTITVADHGKSLKFSGSMTVALSNPGKAVRFTASIFKTSDVAGTITISCSNVAFVFDGSGTYPPDDYAGPWSPGPSPIVLPILGGDPVDQVIMYEFEFIGNVWRITTLFEQNIP